MNTKIFGILLFPVLCLIAVSCKNTGQGITKSITGKQGELVIVISKNAWESTPGELLRKTLAQPQLSLPQEEPIFNLVDIPHDAFTNIFKSTRNIITTHISPTVEKPGVVFQNDVWAYPQATVEINARNAVEFDSLFNKNSDKIIGYFLKAEQNRLKSGYLKTHEKKLLQTLETKFQARVYCPPGFNTATEKENFLWARYDTPEITQGVFFYTIPYTSDSIFTPNYLLNFRDSLLKAYVPGPAKGSYMSTERKIEPVVNTFEHNGNYAVEMRGLWRLENDFMGGPYILLAELDASRQRVFICDGFVYAPQKNKRNYLRQVEAMIYTLSFLDQEKNNKINSQIKMGN